MKNIALLVILIVFFTACTTSKTDEGLTPSRTPVIETRQSTQPSPTELPVISETPIPTATPGPLIVRETRSRTFNIIDKKGLISDGMYLYRSDIQYPSGMIWGPDGYMYIADHNGNRIVRMTPAGEVEDLELWKVHEPWRDGHIAGPNDVTFSPDGLLHFSDNTGIYRVLEGLTIEQLVVSDNPSNSTIPALVINNQNELFFAKTTFFNSMEKTCVRKLSMGEISDVLCDLEYVSDMIFNQDNDLIISTGSKVIKLNTTSIEISTISNLPGFLAVDGDGNLWIRSGVDLSGDALSFYGPDGLKKSFAVVDAPFPLETYLAPSSAIAVDDQNRAWIASYNSHIIRLDPKDLDAAVPTFTLTDIFPSLEPRAIEVDTEGNVYVFNALTFELWKFTEPGVFEVIGKNYEDHFHTVGANREVGLAIDTIGNIYIGFPDGEIWKIDNTGSESHYAWVKSASMAFAADGNLYALESRDGFSRRVLKITGTDEVQVQHELIAGQLIGSDYAGQAFIEASVQGGIYVFDLTSGNIFYSDLAGNEYVVTTFTPDIGVFTASPSGNIYYSLHNNSMALGGGEVMKIRLSSGKIKTYDSMMWSIIEGLIDPWSMAVSPDGKYLYIGDSGTVIRLTLSE